MKPILALLAIVLAFATIAPAQQTANTSCYLECDAVDQLTYASVFSRSPGTSPLIASCPLNENVLVTCNVVSSYGEEVSLYASAWPGSLSSVVSPCGWLWDLDLSTMVDVFDGVNGDGVQFPLSIGQPFAVCIQAIAYDPHDPCGYAFSQAVSFTR